MSLPRRVNSDIEMNRYGWLSSGNEEDMFAIHGACGFSRIVLFLISQARLCAALSRKKTFEGITDIWAEQILLKLQELRQFSEESSDRNTWETAKKGEAVITKVREKPENYVIHDRHEMTEVTAEAWRITAMIYLLCRALRLKVRTILLIQV